MKVLIASVSSRALAQSAVKAGYEPISLDFFGDSDQPAGIETYSLARNFHSELNLKALARAVRELAPRAGAVVLGAGLENEPDLLKLNLPGERWYNSAAAVRSVRDLPQLEQTLAGLPIRFPSTIHRSDPLPIRGTWLLKDPRHSGGTGVRDWNSSPLLDGEYLQEYISGELGSAVFIADGKRALLLGLTRQYAGVRELDAPPFAWCGNVVPIQNEALVETFTLAANRLTRAFGLVGENGIDFILRDGLPYVLEINPRPCGSGELFERWLGINLFELHVRGCTGDLPASLDGSRPTGCWGKGILYAREEITLGDTRGWAEMGIADVPHPGETIPAGSPVCSLITAGNDPEACWQRVLQKAQTIKRKPDPSL